MILGRRKLITLGGQLALLAAMPFRLHAAPLGANPFTLGVAAGDPWPDGFVIWTRLALRPLDEHGGMPMATVPVRWEVAEDDRFARIVRRGEALARPELGHAVHVELDGLRPARPYWYRFIVNGAEISPAGVARTAPAAGALVDRLRIGVGGCQNLQTGYFSAWRHLAAEPDLDLIYHYGDYIYEGAPAASPPPPGRPAPVRRHVGDEIYSLDDYRRRYAQYKSDPDLQRAHAAAAFIASFDDHEVDNNWAGDLDQDASPPEIFRLRRAAAMQAWYEHMPVRRAQFPTPAGLTMYRRFDHGRLLRIHALDTRSYRSDQPCERPDEKACAPVQDGSETMLGAAQERWLAEGLNGNAGWNLMAMQGLFMPFDRAAQPANQRSKGFDNWEGYRRPRQRVIDGIKQRGLTNVVMTGGDSHIHFAGHVPERPEALDSAPVATEFHGTSISSISGNGAPVGTDPRLSTNPHMRAVQDQRGYLLFDVTARQWTTHLRVIDDATRPDGAVSTFASFAMTPDRPRIEPA